MLAAALDEFGESGWDGFSMEHVANRAGVNKTTVYRRWPTKLELLRAAFLALPALRAEPPDTGDVRHDLRVLLADRVERMQTPSGRAIARGMMLGNASPALQSLRETLREQRPAVPDAVIDHAVARGQLRPDLDRATFRELLLAPIHARLFLRDERVDAEFVATVVDVVVAGFRAPASATESPRGSAPAPRAAPSSRSRRGRR